MLLLILVKHHWLLFSANFSVATALSHEKIEILVNILVTKVGEFFAFHITSRSQKQGKPKIKFGIFIEIL